MKSWVLPHEFMAQFDHLECWHEFYNSVTNIIVADERTQRIVFDIWNDLAEHVSHHVKVDIASFVPRTIQMPFHVTLIGSRYGKKDKVYNFPNGTISGRNYRVEDNIVPLIDSIYQAVTNVSDSLGNQWAGSKGLRIKSAPTLSSGPVIHNRPKK